MQKDKNYGDKSVKLKANSSKRAIKLIFSHTIKGKNTQRRLSLLANVIGEYKKKYCKWAHTLDDLDKMNQFLENHKLPVPTQQKEIMSMYNPAF